MGRERTNARPANVVARDPKDRYYTPEWCIAGLVDRMAAALPVLDETATSFQVVVDIGSGDGRIGLQVAAWLRVAQPELHLIEPFPPDGCGRVSDGTLMKLHGLRRVVTHEEDFQSVLDSDEHPWAGRRTLFVSNPPFSQSDKIVRDTLARLSGECGVGSWAFFLLRMDWRASKARATGIMSQWPMTVEFPLSPRPSFCAGASGSNTDFYNYAWHGWSKGGPRTRWSWPIIRAGR